MDQFTFDHMVAWIKRTQREGMWSVVLGVMLHECDADPTIIELGWPRVAEIAGVYEADFLDTINL